MIHLKYNSILAFLGILVVLVINCSGQESSNLNAGSTGAVQTTAGPKEITIAGSISLTPSTIYTVDSSGNLTSTPFPIPAQNGGNANLLRGLDAQALGTKDNIGLKGFAVKATAKFPKIPPGYDPSTVCLVSGTGPLRFLAKGIGGEFAGELIGYNGIAEELLSSYIPSRTFQGPDETFFIGQKTKLDTPFLYQILHVPNPPSNTPTQISTDGNKQEACVDFCYNYSNKTVYYVLNNFDTGEVEYRADSGSSSFPLALPLFPPEYKIASIAAITVSGTTKIALLIVSNYSGNEPQIMVFTPGQETADSAKVMHPVLNSSVSHIDGFAQDGNTLLLNAGRSVIKYVISSNNSYTINTSSTSISSNITDLNGN